MGNNSYIEAVKYRHKNQVAYCHSIEADKY